jgi:hypothetical protein
MSSASSLAMSIDIESYGFPAPLPARQKNATPQHVSPVGSPTDVEMLPMPSSQSLPLDTHQTESQIPQISQNFERDGRHQVVEQMQTVWSPYKNRYRVLAACLMAFANGMNDSAPGALIASIEK